MKKHSKRHIIIGDIHGELPGLEEILNHAGVIDRDHNWSGLDTVLVQTGDVIDRGPHSIESVSLLQILQQQATKARKGKVVRLCGNHELWLLQGNYRHATFDHPEALAKELKAEIERLRIENEAVKKMAGLEAIQYIQNSLLNPKNTLPGTQKRKKK